MGRKTLTKITALTTLSILIGCSKAAESTSVATEKYLYIATGLCNSGQGFTAPTVANVGKTLSRLNLTSNNYEVVKDYADLSEEVSGTYVNGMVDGGDGYIYAAIENATATGSRRVDKIKKQAYGTATPWYRNSTVLSSTPKGIAKAADGGILLGLTTLVERFDSTPTRKMATAAQSWGQTFAGTCATNNTLITDLIALPAMTGASYGKFLYAHQAVGQQDIGIYSMNGNTAAADCLANQAGASALTNAATANLGWNSTLSANASPTSVVYIATPTGSTTGKLLVSYSTNAVNSIAASGLNNALVMYDINEPTTTTATISNGQVLYHDAQYFYGVSSMAYDASSGILYVASSNSLATAPVGYNIEKFSIDLTTPGATRLTNPDLSSYQSSNSFNNCVTGMFVGQ
jgi:hypothetical protein